MRLRPLRDLRERGHECIAAVVSEWPEGGAGFIRDGVADAATIAELKGRHMLIDTYASLFDAVPTAAG